MPHHRNDRWKWSITIGYVQICSGIDSRLSLKVYIFHHTTFNPCHTGLLHIQIQIWKKLHPTIFNDLSTQLFSSDLPCFHTGGRYISLKSSGSFKTQSRMDYICSFCTKNPRQNLGPNYQW